MTDPDFADLTNGVPPVVEKVDEAVVALRRTRRIEIVLVVIGAIGMSATAAFSAWSAYRILSCTTPEGSCYRDTTVRARNANRGFLEELDRQHQVIQCLLRTEQDLAACEAAHPPKRNGP